MPTSTCSDPIYENKIKATVFLALAHYIMHALVVIIVIYIYRPDSMKIINDNNLNTLLSNAPSVSVRGLNSSRKTINNKENK